MAEETIEQMNRLLSDGSAPPMARPSMEGSMPMPPMPRPEIEMITSAQQGLMQMDPVATKDIVDGLEVTKNKVMAGGQLTEVESTGIMSILQKLGGALSGMMGGGADQSLQQVMVDGNVTMLTAKEIMSAKNAGMLVQPVGEAIRSMEPMTGSSTMTPDELMMESSGSTMTDAERAIGANEEFNRRVQEEQERMFNMNNPPVTSSVRPRLRSTQ